MLPFTLTAGGEASKIGMMHDELKKCEWDSCPNAATGHAVFGLRVLEVSPADGLEIFEIAHTLHERDLCPEHIKLAQNSYLYFRVENL